MTRTFYRSPFFTFLFWIWFCVFLHLHIYIYIYGDLWSRSSLLLWHPVTIKSDFGVCFFPLKTFSIGQKRRNLSENIKLRDFRIRRWCKHSHYDSHCDYVVYDVSLCEGKKLKGYALLIQARRSFICNYTFM